jgi:dihydrodipicolinate synthase/N-acetylneuraminate lyase
MGPAQQGAIMTTKAKRDRVAWQGYLPAIVTPFDDDLQLDLAALGTHLEWLVGEGMHGLVVAGTTGEWTSLSAAERKQLFSAVGAQLSGRLPIIAGCTTFTAATTIELAEHAKASGFDGILVTPPPYLRPNADEIVAFYQAVSDGSSLPICVYNWPPGTGIDMPLELLRRLADIENVVAIKQSTSNLASFVDTVFALAEQVRVFGFSMDEHGLTMLQARGGDGTMGAGGVLGRDHPDFYNKLWAGDIEGARACGANDRVLMKEWYTPELVGRFGSGPAILKAGFAARGVPAGRVRPPLIDVDAAGRKSIAETLRALGKI